MLIDGRLAVESAKDYEAAVSEFASTSQMQIGGLRAPGAIELIQGIDTTQGRAIGFRLTSQETCESQMWQAPLTPFAGSRTGSAVA